AMSGYGELAVDVARRCAAEPTRSLASTWHEMAERAFPTKPSKWTKGCPKSSFLGLCEDGFVDQIPTGSYTSSIKNKGYAITAAIELCERKGVPDDWAEWWRIATHGSGISQNHQLEVVSALWRKGLLVDPR